MKGKNGVIIFIQYHEVCSVLYMNIIEPKLNEAVIDIATWYFTNIESKHINFYSSPIPEEVCKIGGAEQ